MNRWKIAGAVTVLFLALVTFTLVQSCHRTDQPQRAEEDPETLDTRGISPAPDDTSRADTSAVDTSAVDTSALSLHAPSSLSSVQ